MPHHTDPPDTDLDEDELAHLAEVKGRLQEKRTELHRTIRAIQQKRHTPEQIRAVIDRARRLVYKSVLLKRRWDGRRQVH